jgi:hypothetical protein
LLSDDLGVVQEVGGQDGAGVEDRDADELIAAPVERDECVEAGRRLGPGRGVTGREGQIVVFDGGEAGAAPLRRYKSARIAGGTSATQPVIAV